MASTTDFFPTDVLLADPALAMSADQRMKLGFLTGFIRNERLAALALALAEQDSEKDLLIKSANESSARATMNRINHEADLVWLTTELKKVLASWESESDGDDTPSAIEAKDSIFRIVASLSERVRNFE